MGPIYFDVVIVGGGAAGFFAAINIAEKHPNLRIAILEKSKDILQKVKISGGGRCNVTHACFDPNELVEFYPRGNKALLGPFHRFAPGDMMHWLDERGVSTKIEKDNRVFPISDSSQSIIDCFSARIKKQHISLVTRCRLDALHAPKETNGLWNLVCGEQVYRSKKVLITSGSSPQVWKILKNLGHRIIPAVPSLFTFPTKDKRIQDLMGLSVPKAQVKIEGERLEDEGPLLITHWGFSGPAILKMSAWGARLLQEKKYVFTVVINWVYPHRMEEVLAILGQYRKEKGKLKIRSNVLFGLPKRLWWRMVESAGIAEEMKWGDVSNVLLTKLTEELCVARFAIKGKSTFKEEFVTAGGVALDEVNFKRFESKLHSGLFFAGEVMDIDAVTGGFNFQAAWTGAWIVSESIGD